MTTVLHRARPAAPGAWTWDSQREIDFRTFISDASDVDRARWADELSDFGCRILQKRSEASVNTTSAHWLSRGAAGASAAVATLSGGALIGDLHGLAATAVGVVAAGLGIVAGAIAAAKPEESYRVDRFRMASYELLWWDIRSFACTKLSSISASDFDAAMSDFAKREQVILGTTTDAKPA